MCGRALDPPVQNSSLVAYSPGAAVSSVGSRVNIPDRINAYSPGGEGKKWSLRVEDPRQGRPTG